MQVDRVSGVLTLLQIFPKVTTPSPEILQQKETPFLNSTPEDIFLSTLYEAGIIDANGYIIAGPHKLPSSLPQIDPKAIRRIQDFLETRFTLEVVLDESAPPLQGSFLLKDLYVYLLSKGAENVLIHGGFVKTVLQDWFQDIFKVFKITDRDLISKLTESFKKTPPDMDIHLMAPNIGENDIPPLNAEICIFIAQLLVPPKEYARLSLDVKVALRKAIIKALNCKIVEIFPPGEWGSGETCSNTAFEKDGEKVDNLCILRLKRYHFAILDALSIPIITLIKNPSSDSLIIPESDYVQIWQPIIDRLAKMIHIDDISEIVPKGLIRFASLLTSDHRCPDRETTTLLCQIFWEKFKKEKADNLICEKIVLHILDHHNNHHSNDYKALIALTFNLFNIFLHNHIPIEIVIEIWKMIQNALPDDKLTLHTESGIWAEAKAPALCKVSCKDEPNIFFLSANALKKNPQSIKVVLAFLQLLGFIQLQTINSNTVKTSLTKHEEKLSLKISEEHTLLLSTQVMEALDILEKEDKKFDKPFWNLLKPLLSRFLSTNPVLLQSSSPLNSHFDELGLSIPQLVKKASIFVNHQKNTLFIQLGYQLLLICHAISPDPLTFSLLIEHFPSVLCLEGNLAQRQTLLENIELILNRSKLLPLKPTKKFYDLINNPNSKKMSLHLELIKGLICSGDHTLITLAIQMVEKSPKDHTIELLNSLSPIPAPIANQLLMIVLNKKDVLGEDKLKLFVSIITQFPQDSASFKNAALKVIAIPDASCSDHLIGFISSLCLSNPSIENLQLLVKATSSKSLTPNSPKVAEVWLKILPFYLENSQCNASDIWTAWKTATDKKVPLTNPHSISSLIFLSSLCEKLYLSDHPDFEICLNIICQDNSNATVNHQDIQTEILHCFPKNIPKAIFLFHKLFTDEAFSQEQTAQEFQVIIQEFQKTRLTPSTSLLLFKTIQILLTQNKQKDKSAKRSTSIQINSEHILWIINELIRANQNQEVLTLLKICREKKQFSPKDSVGNTLRICLAMLENGEMISAANVWIQANKLEIWAYPHLQKEKESLFVSLCKELVNDPEAETQLQLLLKSIKNFGSDDSFNESLREVVCIHAKNHPERCDELINEHRFLFDQNQEVELGTTCLEILLKKSDVSKLAYLTATILNLSQNSVDISQRQRLEILLNQLFEKLNDLKKNHLDLLIELFNHPAFNKIFNDDIEAQFLFMHKWCSHYVEKAKVNEKNLFIQSELLTIFITKIMDSLSLNPILSQEMNLGLIDLLSHIIKNAQPPVSPTQKKALDNLPAVLKNFLPTILQLFEKEKQPQEMIVFLYELVLRSGDFSLPESSLTHLFNAARETLNTFKNSPETLESIQRTLEALKCYLSAKVIPEQQIRTYLSLIQCLIDENHPSAKPWIRRLLNSPLINSHPLSSNLFSQWSQLFLSTKDVDILEFLFKNFEKFQDLPQSDLAKTVLLLANELFIENPLKTWELLKANKEILTIHEKDQYLQFIKTLLRFFSSNARPNFEIAWVIIKSHGFLPESNLKPIFEHVAKSLNPSVKEELFTIFKLAMDQKILLPSDFESCWNSLLKSSGKLEFSSFKILLTIFSEKVLSFEFSPLTLLAMLENLLKECHYLQNQNHEVCNILNECQITLPENDANLNYLIHATIIELLLQTNSSATFSDATEYLKHIFEILPLQALEFPRLVSVSIKTLYQGITQLEDLHKSELEQDHLNHIEYLFGLLNLLKYDLPIFSQDFLPLIKKCSQSTQTDIQDKTLNIFLSFLLSTPLTTLQKIDKLSVSIKEIFLNLLKNERHYFNVFKVLNMASLKEIIPKADLKGLQDKALFIAFKLAANCRDIETSKSTIQIFNISLANNSLSASNIKEYLPIMFDNLFILLKNGYVPDFLNHFVELIQALSSCYNPNEKSNVESFTESFSPLVDTILNWITHPQLAETVTPFITQAECTSLSSTLDRQMYLELYPSKTASPLIADLPIPTPSFNPVWKQNRTHATFVISLTRFLESLLLTDLKSPHLNTFARCIAHSNLEFLLNNYPNDILQFIPVIRAYVFNRFPSDIDFRSHRFHANFLIGHLFTLKAISWNKLPNTAAFRLSLEMFQKKQKITSTLSQKQINEGATCTILKLCQSKDPDMIAHAIDIVYSCFPSATFEVDWLACNKAIWDQVKIIPNRVVKVRTSPNPADMENVFLLNYLFDRILKAPKQYFPQIAESTLKKCEELDINVAQIYYRFLKCAFEMGKFEGRYELFYNLLKKGMVYFIDEIEGTNSKIETLNKYDLKNFFTPVHSLSEDENKSRGEAFNSWIKYLISDQLTDNDSNSPISIYANNLFGSLKEEIYKKIVPQLC